MANASTSTAQPYVVTRPRESDAIGVSLRDAYSGNQRLPDDMMELLLILNGNGGLRDRH